MRTVRKIIFIVLTRTIPVLSYVPFLYPSTRCESRDRSECKQAASHEKLHGILCDSFTLGVLSMKYDPTLSWTCRSNPTVWSFSNPVFKKKISLVVFHIIHKYEIGTFWFEAHLVYIFREMIRITSFVGNIHISVRSAPFSDSFFRFIKAESLPNFVGQITEKCWRHWNLRKISSTKSKFTKFYFEEAEKNPSFPQRKSPDEPPKI